MPLMGTSFGRGVVGGVRGMSLRFACVRMLAVELCVCACVVLFIIPHEEETRKRYGGDLEC